MQNPPYLLDAYEAARNVLSPEGLADAVCTVLRLGRNALREEQQSAFLAPVARAQPAALHTFPMDDGVREIVSICIVRESESHDSRARRVLRSSNLSASRLLLAEWYQCEYGGSTEAPAIAASRRTAIRALCRALPAEVHSDILQGALVTADVDFLALPDFVTLNARLCAMPAPC